ncbi:hypothetical protein BD324DRAFT_616324 [Kockovaella imperatae]|uniref:Cyanovirin-N domain-containing protein n=1 Tax=Kockovaella imperatae TaxID=4999 RepID=A0A1Y1USF4_9TREE|nr:hypothetical protein BD324DRAFT_616324 [Kockovaella imperatae]ORX40115.1 hypothetical protein BD324DRAFT_616324 [Kockovaella imperatae]
MLRFTQSVLLTALIGSALVSADGGFAQSCSSWGGGDGDGTLIAQCEGKQYSISLDQCLGNHNGQLVGQYNGGFGGSCNDFEYSGDSFYATCKNDAGNYGSTGININNIIGFNNPNGLSCFGFYADPCLDGGCDGL